MILPLRDNIIAVPVEATDRVGLLYMPENFKQSLRTHYCAKVLFAGPEAVETCPNGTIIHVTESWGDPVLLDGVKAWIGRMRDINGYMKEGKLVPVGDRVLAKAIPIECEISGILIPENATNRDMRVEVLAVGDKVTDLKAGDIAFIARYVYAEIRVGEEKLILINESNVHAILETA